MGIHVKALTGIELCRRGCPDVKSALCGAPLWMLACAVSKKYFAWLCNPSAGSLSYNTRVTTSHCACARRSGGSGLRSGSRTVGVEVMQSDSLSETVGLAPPRWAGAMAGAGLDGTQPHAGSGTRARIGEERSGSGPPPISSSRSHRSPRPTTARCPEQIQHINMQDAGRGRWQSLTPTERGESR